MTETKKKQLKSEFEKSMSLYEQAMRAFHKGGFDKAEELLAAFVENDSHEKELFDRAQLYLSICRGKKEKKELPLKTFDDYFNAGVYNINSGRFKEALKLLIKAAELKPKEGRAPYMMSLAAFKDGDEEGSLKHLQKAVQIDDFFKILAQNETDFEKLLKNEDFQNIVGME
ncbi:MAG: hypothetical protein KJ874_06460 [Acidobacteria bacterium]|nr:hypothetical protein [Acidobacteriota bacterium]